MFHLASQLIARLSRKPAGAFNSSTAPCERIVLDNEHSIAVYAFDGVRLVFDATYMWRFIVELPRFTTRRTIKRIATAYFRGLDQGQGELRELGLTDEFMAMAHRYADDLASPPRP
jgi:hypothetical protein